MRSSKCFICGRRIEREDNSDVPLYCKEHRAYALQDNEILRNAPYELLFALIAGIFERARDDYIYNKDNQRSDAEVFLKGNWAQELSVRGFDVGAVFESLDTEMLNELRGTDEDTE